MKEGFEASNIVRLVGAQIGGNLECTNGKFLPKAGHALSCDHAVIKGSVFLNDGFKAEGEVRLVSAQIGGNLGCMKGEFSPKAGDALTCDGAVITGTIFFRGVASVNGPLSFSGCHAHHLADDAASCSRVC